jgi:hypothetical protein
MDAITMPSILSPIQQLKSDFPQITFAEGPEYMWSPDNQTVYYPASAVNVSLVLHELSHGLLGHSDYSSDVQLLNMERAAWDKAVHLSTVYNLIVTDGQIETALDSYRDWLHARSTCPSCQATGYQIQEKLYTCPACSHSWRVNEARICTLRRYSADSIQKTPS